ncbi:ribosome biogenesis/translation initiation ATPase RLI [Candidatus Micrarchaeota archaeon]|nr:ribosome biogenesis/translation initiation ATPase RLI [Candidatus Micrarchaeota archaeon]
MVRIAVLDRKLCIREQCGYVCEKVCPVNRMGKECIKTEEDTKFPLISEELCIGCGICVKKCPAQCISIVNLKEEIGTPIYQYGKNAFRIHGLPLPKEGVSGLVGKNGIGKTTALRILTKQIKPNFGVYQKTKKLKEPEMLERMNMELRGYWESAGTQVKLSYKIQNIEEIREAFDGTVNELMEKFGEKGKAEETVSRFGLDKILKRKLSQLSGGEMQKTAIAVTYMKDADIYFFDEPTNYLDIAERMRVAILLKELSERKKVMLVEHDLAILDYASDYVYLFWGDENVYGVVTGVKNVRNGINEYLSGFLKEENIRFRNREIVFSRFSQSETKKKPRFSYGEMRKKYSGFDLRCDAGDIREGEVIGIVGRNALGKSTFVKMLAGVENPTEGDGGGFRVSYKPQYIKAEEGVSVEELFESKKMNGLVFEECKRALDVNRLVLRQLSDLSVGELQRVAITLALSAEADIYLLDEPSAFLDIEQRLNLADLLRKVFSDSGKTAFIVDHDVVFVDAVASRLIVFEGEQSVKGHASAPMDKHDGMNEFLKLMDVTMRRDKDTNRPRINKPESVLDRQQKGNNEYYYAKEYTILDYVR